MESIEKLRELCAKWRKTSITPGRNPAADEVDKIADEIEREIAERYMELPVDADGVPIHVGDVVKCTFADDNATVKYLSLQEDGWSIVVDYPDGRGHRTPDSMRHVNPRTVEDVLFDCYAAIDYDKKAEDGHRKDELLRKYAAELRDLLGGDGR